MTQTAPPPWQNRSPIPAAMFNPALFAAIIATAADQYEETAGLPMPWTLSFLVPPLVLHAPTREVLPRTSRTVLSKWVADHEVLAAGFPARAAHLAPHVREGLSFGLRQGALALVDGAALHSANPLKVNAKAPGDLAPVIRGASMLGRTFGRSGDATTVYAALRVRP
jgi:hypothetical protein